jgi:hypothetical protein
VIRQRRAVHQYSRASRTHGIKKRTREFIEQKLASEAAALANFRRRTEEATAPRRADTNQGCEGGGGADVRAASSELSAVTHASAWECQPKHHRPISTRTGQSVTLQATKRGT